MRRHRRGRSLPLRDPTPVRFTDENPASLEAFTARVHCPRDTARNPQSRLRRPPRHIFPRRYVTGRVVMNKMYVEPTDAELFCTLFCLCGEERLMSMPVPM